jgi:hypothetical protein
MTNIRFLLIGFLTSASKAEKCRSMAGEVPALLLTDSAGFSMGVLGNDKPILSFGFLGATTEAPHSVQNLIPSTMGCAHLGQPLTAEPHSVQNFTPSSIGCLHFEQVFISDPRIKMLRYFATSPGVCRKKLALYDFNNRFYAAGVGV